MLDFDCSHVSLYSVSILFLKSEYDSNGQNIAILGLSWNLSLAENLTSLSLQDGPQSGIIISLEHTYLPVHPPTASVFRWEYLSTH